MIAMQFQPRAGRNARATVAPSMTFPGAKPASIGPDDVAIAGAAATPLNADQRQRLACCARRAYKAQQDVGLIEGESFDDWRHARIREATGCAGLRELSQKEYGPVMARLIELAGGTPRRRDWYAAGKPGHRDDADRARRALKDECAEWAEVFGGVAQADAYATTLLAKIHKTDWMGATAKQLWQVLFTVRNRARAKNRAGCPARPLSPEPCLGASEARKAASPVFPGPSRAPGERGSVGVCELAGRDAGESGFNGGEGADGEG